MEAASEAFAGVSGRQGSVIGIIRSAELPHVDVNTGHRPDVRNPPNRWVEIPIFTHLPYSGDRGKDDLSRNHINVLTSDVIVALPGSAGTLSEIELALEYERPIILFLGKESVNGRKACDFLRDVPPAVRIADDLGQLEEQLREFLAG